MEANFTKKMERISLVAFAMFLFCSQSVLAQNAGDFRTRGTITNGNWSLNTTWQRYNGSAWFDAGANVIPSATSEVFIRDGVIVTVDGTTDCATLSMSVDGTQGSVVITGAGVALNIHNKIRGYTGTATTGTSPSSNAIGSNSLQTTSNGKLVFVGNSTYGGNIRSVMASNEWNTSANKIDVEVNLTATQQLSLAGPMGVRSLSVNSGTLLAGTNRIYVEENVTIAANGEFASSVSGSPVFSKLDNSTAGTLMLANGGKLVFFGANPSVNMTSLSLTNGTVTYELAGATDQNLITVNNGNPVLYGNLSLKSTANKVIPTTNTLQVNGTLTIDSDSKLVLNQGILTLNGNLDGAGTITADNLASITIGGSGTLTESLKFTSGAANQELKSLTINRNTGIINLGTPLAVNEILNLQTGKLFTTNTSILTLRHQGNIAGVVTGVTINGGNENSYVEGPVACILNNAARATATFLFFPIGMGGAYRPVTLSQVDQDGGLETYTAVVKNSEPTRRTLVPADNITHVSAIRHFTIEKAGMVTLHGSKVNLTYGADDKVDADPNYLTIVKSNGTSWEDLGRDGNNSTGTVWEVNGNITSANSFTTFSDFVLGNKKGAWNTLPVELVSFDAKLNRDQVLLNWATASETNNKQFVVERSAKGSEFTAIATVKGKGNTSNVVTYAVTDRQPLNGVSYYRLKQEDFDGSVSYSKVVTVSARTLGSIALYPNPATEKLIVALPDAAGKFDVIIVNLLGQAVRSQQLESIFGNEVELNVANLPAGTYQVKVTGSNGTLVGKFVKAAL